jgi:hemerythrin
VFRCVAQNPEISESFLTGKESMAADEVLQTMQDWFLNHILIEDKKYTPCLKSAD